MARVALSFISLLSFILLLVSMNDAFFPSGGIESFMSAAASSSSLGSSLPRRRGLARRDHGNDVLPTFPDCPQHPLGATMSTDPLPKDIQQALERWRDQLDALSKQHGVHQASVSVVFDQKIIWHHGIGKVGSSDVGLDTVFRVGSITKVLTDLLLLKAHSLGLVDMDDAVEKVVPSFSVVNPFPGGQPITWRSLATQTSGIGGATPCRMFTMEEPVLNNDCEITNDEAWNRLSKQWVDFPQYSYAHYADSAYEIIGRALESVFHMSYEDAMHKYIFAPLGMNATFFDLDWERYMSVQLPAGRMGGVELPSFVSHADMHWARPTGQVYSTNRDLARLLSAYFRADRDSMPDGSAKILPSHLIRMSELAAFVNDDALTAYGFPFEMFHTRAFGPDDEFGGYWINSKAGAFPGYTSAIAMVPPIKLGFVAQSTDVFADALMMLSAQALLPAFHRHLSTHAPPLANPGNLSAFEGTYTARLMMGYIEFNVTIEASANPPLLRQAQSVAIGGGVVTPAGPPAWYNFTWTGHRNRFAGARAKLPCMFEEAGPTGNYMVFQTDHKGTVTSLEFPNTDPEWGVTYKKV